MENGYALDSGQVLGRDAQNMDVVRYPFLLSLSTTR